MIEWVDDDAALPEPETAGDPEVPGLVAAGGGLGLARLNEAYRKGLFPWFSAGQPVLWWSPDPRMVLPVDQFVLRQSLRKTLRKFLRTPGHAIRFDTDFRAVIEACATAPREGQDGTWIVPDMVEAYVAWHKAGYVHSVETWVGERLVGGLYFVSIGRMVFGESMFSYQTDASKLALAALVAACSGRGVTLIDCQQHTGHLASFGAREIPRQAFRQHLTRTLGEPSITDWTYDPAHWAHLDGVLSGPGEIPA